MILGFLIFVVFSLSKCFVIDIVFEFEKNCFIGILGERNCFFVVLNKWNFLRFWKWLEKLNEKVINVWFDLECFDGVIVFLLWFFRVRNFWKIYVKNCLIDGYYFEYNIKLIYSNMVWDMVFIDVVIFIDIN